ncbi:MAG: CDP-glycerol glycerophosphotransferase family protein [Eubacteriaceae bacterium]
MVLFDVDDNKNMQNINCFVKDMKWERINLIVEGFLEKNETNDLEGYLVLKCKKSKKELAIAVDIIDNKFKVKINMMIINGGYPLENGMWDILLRIVENNETSDLFLFYNNGSKEKNFANRYKYGKNRYVIYPSFESRYNNLCIDIIDYKVKKRKKRFSYKLLKKKLRKKIYRFTYHIFYKIFKQKSNHVLFASDTRSELSGNMKDIYEEILERDMDLKCRFVFKKTNNIYRKIPDKFKLPYYLAISKYVFFDDYYPMINFLKFQNNKQLIQLWHAVGAFKTFGYSRIGKVGGPNPFSPNHRVYTKAIVSSKEVAKYYAEGFGMTEDKVFATGIPRTDIFFNEEYKSNVKQQLYKTYPMLKNKKIITFAPTFRGSGPKNAYYDYNMIDFDKLYEICGEEYCVIFKIHFLVRNQLEIPEQYKDKFIDMSSYREINDLLFITDILITDYSSTCFEFSLLNRPMIFFAYDLEDYISKRDFYYEYENFVPGKICRTFDEVIHSIKYEDFELDKVKKFRDKFFEHTDGKSTDRVIDLVFGKKEGDN